MGYRGKPSERQQARQLRRAGLPYAEIATRLGVSKSSVSLWVRDVEFTPPPPPAPGPPSRPQPPSSAASRPRSTAWSGKGRSGTGR